MKVEPISILPVGENLIDHPIIDISPITIDNPEYSWNPDTNQTFEDVDNFLRNGTGPLTISYHGSAAAFVSSGRDVRDWPDLQIYYSFVGNVPSSVGSLIEMNRPKSRGRIRLNTTAESMLDNRLPIIDFNYFEVETDLEVLVDGIELTLKIYENTTAFQNLGARYNVKPHKLCEGLSFRSREYWKCYVKHRARSTWHVVGTCKMGMAGSETTVVDSKLRVQGVTNLRVVDASIMPFPPNANTNAAVMMIAEKAASELLQEYQIKHDDKSEL
ncbi:unnamed protein product [Allacma fusca]|uniref:Glucose-methanol-choline oxidoreductase C-terminal domain-containing protein n=1 Tax=Allacma fusca TaxID=39272 RepID=A0A8J2KBN3_9HEXA|nr:unnamed protein product [Allacma fusca]